MFRRLTSNYREMNLFWKTRFSSWLLADQWNFEGKGPQIQTHDPGLPLIKPKARWDLVYIVSCFDSLVKCGHISKQADNYFY